MKHHTHGGLYIHTHTPLICLCLQPRHWLLSPSVCTSLLLCRINRAQARMYVHWHKENHNETYTAVIEWRVGDNVPGKWRDGGREEKDKWVMLWLRWGKYNTCQPCWTELAHRIPVDQPKVKNPYLLKSLYSTDAAWNTGLDTIHTEIKLCRAAVTLLGFLQ